MKKIEEISDDGIDYRKLYDDSVNAITSLDNKPESRTLFTTSATQT